MKQANLLELLGTRTDGQLVSRVDYLGPIHFRETSDKRHVEGEFDARLTDEGFLKIDGHISSIGVYSYSDGETTWGELRTADEIFDQAALDSFALVPLTDDHPDSMVSLDNVGDVQRGHVGSNVRPDEDKVHVLADMVVTNADLIAKIKDGKTQLSCGYQSLVIAQDGVAEDGTPFAAKQTKIRGNHLAVVDLARGGPTCRLLLDAVDGAFSITQDGSEMKVKKKLDGTVVIDGTEHVVPDAVASAFQSMSAKLNEEGEEEKSEDAEEEEEEKSTDEEEEEKSEDNVTVAKDSSADLAKMQAKIDSLSAKLDAERDSSSSKIDARVALVVKARDILGADCKTDGVSDIKLMRQVVANVTPAMKRKVDKGSPDYVSAAYEMAIDAHGSRVDSSQELLTLTHEAIKSDGETVDLDALYSSHLDGMRNGVRVQKEAN